MNTLFDLQYGILTIWLNLNNVFIVNTKKGEQKSVKVN